MGFVFKISAASHGRYFCGKDHGLNPSDNNLNAKTLVSGMLTMVFVFLLTFSCLRPLSLLICQHFRASDPCLCLSANVVVFPTIGKAFPTIGKAFPTIGKIVCRRILLLFNKIAIVSDHGRKGFADWFCLSANGFVSPTIVFVSSLTAGRLRQCFYLFANGFVSSTMVSVFPQTAGRFRQCFCHSANGFVSSTIVFASSLTAGRLRRLSLFHRPWQ
jgi:hypothetical protein